VVHKLGGEKGISCKKKRGILLMNGARAEDARGSKMSSIPKTNQMKEGTKKRLVRMGRGQKRSRRYGKEKNKENRWLKGRFAEGAKAFCWRLGGGKDGGKKVRG